MLDLGAIAYPLPCFLVKPLWTSQCRHQQDPLLYKTRKRQARSSSYIACSWANLTHRVATWGLKVIFQHDFVLAFSFLFKQYRTAAWPLEDQDYHHKLLKNHLHMSNRITKRHFYIPVSKVLYFLIFCNWTY